MITFSLVPPLIFVRFISLLIFIECLILAVTWVKQNPHEWFYMTPPVLIFIHATLFYSVYLFDYFYDTHPFSLQFYADWGAFFILHIAFTSFFALLDLRTSWFTDFIEKHFPGACYGRSR